MKMSKRIASLLITVIMLLGMMTVFASAAGASIKLVNWTRNDFFDYTWTGGGKDSWVGIYYASETPGKETPALLWKATGGAESGKDNINNGKIYGNQDGVGGTRYGENYTTLNPGDYKICLFKDDGYEVIAEQKFTVKKYDVTKDSYSTYLSDLKWISWHVYLQDSSDIKSESNPDGLELSEMNNKVYLDRQVGGFDYATNAFDYGDGASATTNLIINVAGINYEKGVSLALSKEYKKFEATGKEEKYCEVVFDVSGVTADTFSCVFGKNTPGQIAVSLGGCEILADDKIVFSFSKEITKKEGIDVKCSIPEGTKTLTLRAYSLDGDHHSGGVNFADAKLYVAKNVPTGDTGIAVSAVALVAAASAAAVVFSKKKY